MVVVGCSDKTVGGDDASAAAAAAADDDDDDDDDGNDYCKQDVPDQMIDDL